MPYIECFISGKLRLAYLSSKIAEEYETRLDWKMAEAKTAGDTKHWNAERSSAPSGSKNFAFRVPNYQPQRGNTHVRLALFQKVLSFPRFTFQSHHERKGPPSATLGAPSRYKSTNRRVKSTINLTPHLNQPTLTRLPLKRGS